jgi:hypothetical protein
MAANFLQRSRHGSVFYFRRRVPNDLRILIGQAQIFRSLHTTDRREANVRVRALATQSDRLFTELRDMAKKEQLFRTDYKLTFHLDASGKPSAIDGDAEPHETEAVISTLTAGIAAASNARGTGAVDGADSRPEQSENRSAVTPGGYEQPAPRLCDAMEAYIASAKVKPTTARRYAPVLRSVKDFFGADTRLDSIRTIALDILSPSVRSRAR